ncbi:MAG: hypothetical protein DRQ06_05410 [Candidatus Hydrothermota bacterium]|nr:MAG: hypothetical protein DRQ06_05410 [Candidatus Hydrothermae bacterium]
MIEESKIIRDPIHGNIKVEDVFLDLIKAPEIQRLYNIKQLGFAHLVFPGAHHTRLEHSLGTYYLAYETAEKLGLDKDDKKLIACAAILHDIGHGPFSHTLESLLRDSINVDHIDLTEELIYGKHTIFEHNEKEFIESPTVHEILDKHEMDHKKIVNLIRGTQVEDKKYLSQILNSAVDVDQLDYIIRDSYYTGVAYGIIDIERFLQTLTLSEDTLAIRRKGIGVVENILLARTLMYSSVYFHKTVRIAELMLSKAIELAKEYEPFDFFKMTDAELIYNLKNKGSFQSEIATRLKYRNLFKQAYAKSKSDVPIGNMDVIKKLEDIDFRRDKEEEFEKKLEIPKGHIIIDAPTKELHLSEPRIAQTDILVVDEEGKHRTLEELTPIANAVKMREIPNWVVMIVTDEKYRALIAENAEKILFN